MAQVNEQQENTQYEKLLSEGDQRSFDPCRDRSGDCRNCDHGLNDRTNDLGFDTTRGYTSFTVARISFVDTAH